MVDCANSGADMTLSVMAGALTGVATLGLPVTGDEYVDMAVSATFGVAESLLVDGVAQGIQNTGNASSSNINHPIYYPVCSGGGGATMAGKPVSRTSVIR